MKLIAELNDEKHAVEIKRDGLNLTADVDRRIYELEISEPEPNVWLFKHANKIYQIFVAPNERAGEPFAVNVGNQTFDIKILDPKRLRGSSGDGEHADGASEIKTAMPGKLVRILVEKGAEIKKGDGVLIVEAMKMQNEMKSPKDGIVKEIRFAEGATVNAGDVLAIIE
ncbi:MAG: acetyl-CoA carboxylase biotin carboxyl carrier protein subunit [Pyrinomonadaceae bacterium]|nr:acetyl-CoA carboxylase biotin carboxyl carrier protein subunit [Pyrinomonadaceae bacterium]